MAPIPTTRVVLAVVVVCVIASSYVADAAMHDRKRGFKV
jgi:hypothetical protein